MSRNCREKTFPGYVLRLGAGMTASIAALGIAPLDHEGIHGEIFGEGNAAPPDGEDEVRIALRGTLPDGGVEGRKLVNYHFHGGTSTEELARYKGSRDNCSPALPTSFSMNCSSEMNLYFSSSQLRT